MPANMATRTRVLSAFKELHRTCQAVYAGNRRALRASRWKVNTEFKRFKDEPSAKKIEDHIQFARDASRLVRLTAVQGTAERVEARPADRYENNQWKSEKRQHHHARNWTRRGDQEDGAWGGDYPYYANNWHKSQHKKKPRHIDSANFDLSKMTGKRR
ncbi:uncharacterized protein LOC143299002 [Babylonia areolata]|uniref:uncharacterized protein LOC143299002 n=1 Tax=Babylonia areolata TaxID=304850 RepID=UPI003FD487E5